MRERTNYRATDLAKVLEEEGRKARWLAERVGISESHLSRVITGERPIAESLATKIAGTLDRPLFLLFEFTDVNDQSRQRSVAA